MVVEVVGSAVASGSVVGGDDRQLWWLLCDVARG